MRLDGALWEQEGCEEAGLCGPFKYTWYLWTGRKAFKISHWQEEKKIGNLSSFFTLSFEYLVTLVYFSFDSQMSFQKLPSCFFFFFNEMFNFSSENRHNHWDMRWILLHLLVLSAEFNLTLSTKSGKVFSYNSWAVLDIPYSFLHLSNSPNIYWMPATESLA